MANKSQENDINRFETELVGRKLIIESGRMAGQTNASCTVQYGDTVVLATAVISKQPREGVSFFPLMVDYEERLYAAGKIKGSRWIKREGRPSDEAVISARLIDRSIRPLFNQAIQNDVQVVVTVLSFDGENDPDVPALIATSAVLSISDIPFNGPIGGVRLGRVVAEEGKKAEWIINPVFEAREKSDVDLIIAGDGKKIIMIEANAKEVSEADVFAGMEAGQKEIKKIVDFINKVQKEIGKKKISVPETNEGLSEEETPETQKELDRLKEDWIQENVAKTLFDKNLPTKKSRKKVVEELQEQLLDYLESKNIGKDRRKKAISDFKERTEAILAEELLKNGKRVDGRKLDEIRSLSAEVGILPRTHGSGLFSRGETQVLSVVTLGAPGDEQLLEGLEDNGAKRYMHHYNFPSFCVGETGPMRSPGRREIGHGSLAERALLPVLPDRENFPYTIRVVSEVLSSNGSSSMGAVCGSSLALMDAGVPIKNPVAGIAMGLASDDQGNYKILTDLQDLEDGPGGMDFKIAGTKNGITAIQMDTKTLGLTMEMCQKTLEQSKKARVEILDLITKTIPKPKKELSPYAPRIISFMIDPSKIRDVIGSGGKIINEIINETGVQIDIEQDGLVMITGTEPEGVIRAEKWIKDLTREVKVGEIFEGKVSRILDFGAIVDLTPNRDGLVHISEMAHYRVNKVEDIVKLGDIVKVKVIGVEDGGKVSLSIKALTKKEDYGDDGGQSQRRPRRLPNTNRRPKFRR